MNMILNKLGNCGRKLIKRKVKYVAYVRFCVFRLWWLHEDLILILNKLVCIPITKNPNKTNVYVCIVVLGYLRKRRKEGHCYTSFDSFESLICA